jgi:cytochrome c
MHNNPGCLTQNKSLPAELGGQSVNWFKPFNIILAVAAFSMVGTAFYWRVQGDPKTGRRLAENHCAVCHDLTSKSTIGRGPYLWAIVGRPAGVLDNFRYSESFRTHVKQLDLHWTKDNLDQLLQDPGRFIPDIAMAKRKSPHALAFDGIQGRDNRRDLIAFLETLQ